MAKLILHIGMNKTGSSAIQSSLFAAGENVSFVYPKLGEAPFKPHHTDALLNLFSRNSPKVVQKRQALGKQFSPSDRDQERISQAATDAGGRSVILSSEGVYSYFGKADLAALKSFAEQLFDSITVVAYVREPVELISSSFWRRIKGSRLSEFTPSYKPYRQFQKFDRVFGRDKVRLWKYDRDTFPDGNVVRHFCAQLGLQPPALAKTKNVTLSRPAVSAIYRLNKVLAASAGDEGAHRIARLAIADRFPHGSWPKFRLADEALEPLIQANAADIEWIERRMGCSLRTQREPQEDAVATEADLLDIDPRALSVLRGIGDALPPQARSLLERALGGQRPRGVR